jgi:hypothetical protein
LIGNVFSMESINNAIRLGEQYDPSASANI